jgi:hypothetical protein
VSIPNESPPNPTTNYRWSSNSSVVGNANTPNTSFAPSTNSGATGFLSRRATSLLSYGGNSENVENTTSTTISPPPLSAPPYIHETPSKSSSGYPINITHLGKLGFTITLNANTFTERKLWKEKIERQKKLITEKSVAFEKVTISKFDFKLQNNRVTCSATFGKLY